MIRKSAILLATVPFLAGCVTPQESLKQSADTIIESKKTLQAELATLRSGPNADPRRNQLLLARQRLLYGSAMGRDVHLSVNHEEPPSINAIMCPSDDADKFAADAGLKQIDGIASTIARTLTPSKKEGFALIGALNDSYSEEFKAILAELKKENKGSESKDISKFLNEKCKKDFTTAYNELSGSDTSTESFTGVLAAVSVIDIDKFRQAVARLERFVGNLARTADNWKRTKAAIEFIARDDVQSAMTLGADAVANEFTRIHSIQRIGLAREAVLQHERMKLAYITVGAVMKVVIDKKKTGSERLAMIEKSIKTNVDPLITKLEATMDRYDTASSLKKPAAIRAIGTTFQKIAEVARNEEEKRYAFSLKRLMASFEFAKSVLNDAKTTRDEVKKLELNKEISKLKSALKAILSDD